MDIITQEVLEGLLSNQGPPILPPAFVDGTANDRSSGTSPIVVTAPSGIADGDVLYAFVAQQASGANAATISGFTQILHDSSSNPTITILKKTAASESGNYSVSATTSVRAAAAIVAFRGGGGTQDTVGTPAYVTSATSAASSITPTSNGTLLAMYAIANVSNRTTPPAGMTEAIFSNITYNIAIYYLTPQAAAATGNKTMVWSASARTVAVLMQIK